MSMIVRLLFGRNKLIPLGGVAAFALFPMLLCAFPPSEAGSASYIVIIQQLPPKEWVQNIVCNLYQKNAWERSILRRLMEI